MYISPEIVLEQVAGYAVGVAQLIPEIQNLADKNYHIAMVPYGPYFYTGILQAAGYLLLDDAKKKMIIISSQDEDAQNILVNGAPLDSFLGFQRENTPPILKQIASKIKGKVIEKPNQTTLDKVQLQLPFIKVISQTETIIHIGIGDKINATKITTFTQWVQKNRSAYNIVFLHNFNLSTDKKNEKINDQKLISDTMKKPTVNGHPLMKIFHQIAKNGNKKPEIVAYSNPQRLWSKANILTRYLCAVA